MNPTTLHAPAATPITPSDADTLRWDPYDAIHKALRLMLTRSLTDVGRCDPADADEVQRTLQGVRTLLDLCASHLVHENTFVHPAIERACPGASARIAADHDHHEETIADLRDLAGLAADTRGAVRAGALARLYRKLALFVADNLQHMEVEQTEHNAVLWAHYTDAELHAIQDALVASIPPEEMALSLRWFLPAMNPAERAGMLGGMRAAMPPAVFDGGPWAIAREVLSATELAKLARALTQPPAAGRVAA